MYNGDLSDSVDAAKEIVKLSPVLTGEVANFGNVDEVWRASSANDNANNELCVEDAKGILVNLIDDLRYV